MGVILGTAAYMSPEQARGKEVDKRTDIWAYGCVLYEMLTASRAFKGDDVSDTLAAVIAKHPDWVALPSTVPTAVRTLLRHCLQESLRDRLCDIGDARIVIDDALAGLDHEPPVGSLLTAGRRTVPWFYLPLVALSAVGLTLVWGQPRAEPPPASPKRLVLQLPNGDQLAFGESAPVGEGRPSLAISLDGGEEPPVREVHVVLNWFEELKRLTARASRP